MSTKQVTLYQVREYVGASYSNGLGRKLRARSKALRIVRRLKQRGRDAFAVPLRIAA